MEKHLASEYDVIIVGSGPSGSTCAALLGRQGKKVLLVDKASFPRDKTCGDAISGKSISVLRELGLTSEMEKVPHSKIFGVTFSSPDGTIVKVPMPKNDKGEYVDFGYCCRREVYDNMLNAHAKKHATVLENFQVSDVLMENGYMTGIRGKGKDGVEKEFHAKMIVGADGATSMVARKAGLNDVDQKHWCAAVRSYYSGVTGMDDTIELHFVDAVLPGYFWIFPLENGLANVGVGMLLKDISSRKMNLKDEMYKLVQEHPMFKERFKNAKEVSPLKAWNLPFGSKRRKSYGNGFVLLGDAAALIDPFTGEGIGNAMTSASIAARHISMALAKGDVSENALREYDAELWATIGPEIRTSYQMQWLGGHAKFLLNFVMHKVAKSPSAREAIAGTLLNSEARKSYFHPGFYVKLLLS